jgi:hypothetical protein
MLSLEESLIYTPEPSNLSIVPMNPMIFPDTLGINFIYHTVFSHIVSAETSLFLNLEIQRSQCINVRKLFKGGNYMRKYGNLSMFCK